MTATLFVLGSYFFAPLVACPPNMLPWLEAAGFITRCEYEEKTTTDFFFFEAALKFTTRHRQKMISSIFPWSTKVPRSPSFLVEEQKGWETHLR